MAGESLAPCITKHQQPWHWLCKWVLVFHKDFNNLHRLSVEKWKKMQIYFPKLNSAWQGLRITHARAFPMAHQIQLLAPLINRLIRILLRGQAYKPNHHTHTHVHTDTQTATHKSSVYHIPSNYDLEVKHTEHDINYIDVCNTCLWEVTGLNDCMIKKLSLDPKEAFVE